MTGDDTFQLLKITIQDKIKKGHLTTKFELIICLVSSQHQFCLLLFT